MRGFGGLVATTAAAVVLTGPGALRAQAADRDVPDLAIVVTNGTARTVALRSGQRDFARLWQLLSPTDTDSEPVPDAWQDGRRLPRVRVTVLWGMTGIGGWPYTQRAPGGDVAMERVDQVFVAADGAVWVRTDPAPDVEDDDIRWHQASRTVFAELDRDGLLGAKAAATTTAKADEGPSDSVRWAVTGLAGGLALGVGGSFLIRRAAARREPGPPREPRQELIDL